MNRKLCICLSHRQNYYIWRALSLITYQYRSTDSQIIGVYKSKSWTSIGTLKQPRYSYGAVEQNGIVMIVGGRRTLGPGRPRDLFRKDRVQ